MPLMPDDLRVVAARYPDRTALRVVDGETLTFAQWDQRSNAVARNLVAGGIEPGDRVVLLLPNEAAVRYHVAYYAVHKAGAITVPVNPRYAQRELDHILANSGARAVVTTDALRARVDGRGPELVVADHEWAELEHGDTGEFQVGIDPSAVADILYTSGTTGLPKGVAATHDNQTTQPARPLPDGGLLLHSIPLPTFVGTHGAMTMGLRFGITNLLLPSFDAHRFAALIETERPGWVLAVPAHFLLLLESGALDGRDTSSVTVLVYGSAPTPPQAVERLAEAFPNALLLGGYGLTEGGGSVVTMPPGEAVKRPDSVGKAMPGVELRIVDDNRAVLGTGEVGEVEIKVPTGQRRYWSDDEATAATWQDGWVRTGDLGRLDDEGFLYLVDRKKDMIVRGGYNVYSIEVESALFEHPDVVEVAVLGVPHPVLGQDICAVVRLAAGAPEPTLDELREFVADRLADYKRPRRLVLRAEPLPRSGMDKVDKKALAAELAPT